MNRNQRLEQAVKRLHQKQVDKQLTQIYAALAVALYEMLSDSTEEERQEFISSVFARSQEIWQQSIQTGMDVRQLCINVTGIDVMTDERVR